jgi:hypothetical protein
MESSLDSALVVAAVVEHFQQTEEASYLQRSTTFLLGLQNAEAFQERME